MISANVAVFRGRIGDGEFCDDRVDNNVDDLPVDGLAELELRGGVGIGVGDERRAGQPRLLVVEFEELGVPAEADGLLLAGAVDYDLYLGGGIGTELLLATLSYGKQLCVEHVWLPVERGNRLAVNLHNDVGFAVVDDEGYDIEMALTL